MSYKPSTKTLAKYGLSLHEWEAIKLAQGGVCAVCKQVPGGRFCTDHDHVRGWKKLPPEKRKIHVRGLLCWFCNEHFLGRGITVAKSKAVTAYLEAHTDRMVQFAIGAEGQERKP